MEILEGLKQQLGVPIEPERAELKTLGLNHLSWHYGFTVDGEDVWPQILEGYLQKLGQESEPEWDVATIDRLGMIPNYYLQYYYYTGRKLALQQNWPPSRAEVVMEVEAELLRKYAEPERSEPPEELLQRGGAYYSTMATQLLNAHYDSGATGSQGETHILNMAHGGAVAGWPADWVLEMPCRVDDEGIHPIPADPLPLACSGLLAQVKAYELLTVKAAVAGDRRAAFQALLTHPLGPPADQVQGVLNDLLKTNQKHLVQF
jgi:6-phospho-beta-glucosidase